MNTPEFKPKIGYFGVFLSKLAVLRFSKTYSATVRL
jgi:hypothetical protein